MTRRMNALASTATFLIAMCVLGRAGNAQPAGAASDTAWPLRIDSPGGLIAIYQPQPESLTGDKLAARAAISVTPPNAAEPVFGAMWMSARIFTDRDARMVTIVDLTVKRVRFPNQADEQQKQFADVIEQQVPKLHVAFSLDQLMTSLDVAEKEKAAADQLQTTPPKILVTNTLATLVIVDGEPKLQATDQPRVMRVINTPFVMLFDLDAKRYYLKAGEVWTSAADVTGQWDNVARVPASVAAVGDKIAQPAQAADPNAPVNPPQRGPVRIVAAEEPTELIATDGEPAYTPLPGNDLLYVSNTQSDVFMDVSSQNHYVLLSGRWYHSRTLKGPWEFTASETLPAAFAQIPTTSVKAHVLASVATTVQARDARLDARIPQTAAISRTSGRDLAVAYDGDPDFQPIEQTQVSYAVNTSHAVLRVHDHYYCCHQAAWYDSAAPVGPWIVSVSVPEVIYTIPPSCPVYNVRYVYVYDSTPDVVYCGYLPGYTGCYVYGPTVVYGTGYVYRSWDRHAYYGWPKTWGVGARYDDRIGTWGHGAVYGWDARWIAVDEDRRGWWGPRGYVDYHRLAEPRYSRVTNVHETHVNNTYINIYNRTENIKRNVADTRVTNVRTENIHNETVHNVNPPAKAGAHENNVYAGHDGQVYRRTNEGWEQSTDKGWSKITKVPESPAPTPKEHPALEHRDQPPVKVNPADVHAPKHADSPPDKTPAHGTPSEHKSPSEAGHSNTSGLEADHSARERGVERTKGQGDPSGHNSK